MVTPGRRSPGAAPWSRGSADANLLDRDDSSRRHAVAVAEVLLEPTSGAKAQFDGIDDRVGAAPTLDPHTFRLQMRDRLQHGVPIHAKARGKRFAGRETLAGRECAACDILGKGVADLSPQTDAPVQSGLDYPSSPPAARMPNRSGAPAQIE